MRHQSNRPHIHAAKALLQLVFLGGALTFSASAAPIAVPPTPATAASVDTLLQTEINGVTIRMWIPGGIQTLRGVMVKPADSAVGGQGPWLETLRNQGFAEIGMAFKTDGRTSRETILRKALQEAMQEFGAKSGHREIPDLPMFLAGMSRSGGWSAGIAEQVPERAIGYTNVVVGWVANSKGAPSFLKVPGLFLIGSKPDGFKMLDAIARDYDPERAKNAPCVAGFAVGRRTRMGQRQRPRPAVFRGDGEGASAARFQRFEWAGDAQ